MNVTLSRQEELRNDIENLEFAHRFYIGKLDEFEQLGLTHSRQYKSLERNIKVINHNIKRIEKELAV